MAFLVVDEPRAQSAEWTAEVFAAVRRGGIRTFITNDPTSSYAHFYREKNAVDIWCSQAFALPYEKVIDDKRCEYWAYPNHNATEIKDRVIMQKGGRMTYGYGLWRSGYAALMPWAWRWFPGGRHTGEQFDYLRGSRVSGSGNRLDEKGNFIPAVYWECFREGYDDGRYLYTLQQAVAERKQSTDPRCRDAVRNARKLLDEIWQRIEPRKKYLTVDFFDDVSFRALRWRIASITMELLQFDGRSGVTAPSVPADTHVRPAEKDDAYYIRKALKDGAVEYLDLARNDFAAWKRTGDKELTFSVDKNGGKGPRMHIEVKIDHKHDGLHEDNRYPIGWPYVFRDLEDEHYSPKGFDFFYCRIKFNSTYYYFTHF
jgi:hypothetical protein